jgi:hypothetical protein
MLRKQFYSIVFDLKIIGNGNPDNNLESLCILRTLSLSWGDNDVKEDPSTDVQIRSSPQKSGLEAIH